jgi:hypothetical protein
MSIRPRRRFFSSSFTRRRLHVAVLQMAEELRGPSLAREAQQIGMIYHHDDMD